MTTFTTPNSQQDQDTEFDGSRSRRDLMRRLATLGLVAASGMILAPLTTEAKGTSRGHAGRTNRQEHDGNKPRSKQKGKGGEHRQGRKPGGTKGPQESGKDSDTQGSPRLHLPDLPDPRVVASLVIHERTNANTYPVHVSGTISFDPELVAMMQSGRRQFRLTCQLWDVDDNVPESKRADIPFAAGRQIFTSGQSHAFRFSHLVSRSTLDEDCDYFFCSGGPVDEVVARLYLWTRRLPSTGAWIPAKRTNGLSYYQTNQVVRVF